MLGGGEEALSKSGRRGGEREEGECFEFHDGYLYAGFEEVKAKRSRMEGRAVRRN